MADPSTTVTSGPPKSWWLGHEHRQYHPRWNFGYVALSDGRFCLDGSSYHIRDNQDLGGKPNNFPTREQAIRVGCARLIRQMLYERHSTATGMYNDHMTGERLVFAINWALQTCARACGQPTPRRVRIAEPSPPPKPKPFTLPAAKYAAAHGAELADAL